MPSCQHTTELIFTVTGRENSTWCLISPSSHATPLYSPKHSNQLIFLIHSAYVTSFCPVFILNDGRLTPSSLSYVDSDICYKIHLWLFVFLNGGLYTLYLQKKAG